MKGLLSAYSVRYPESLVYMLQNVEYRSGPYLRWLWRVPDFSLVMRRRRLEYTKSARLLLLTLRLGMLLQVVVGFFLMMTRHNYLVGAGLVVVISYPVVWGHMVIAPLLIGRLLFIGPRENRLIAQSKQIFAKHPGILIAIAGSYGKTSMKELLATVLAEGKKVAATPGNMNTPISHARFASSLEGNEDILLVEFGEGKPGDVARFAQTTQPDIGIITGIAPAHLDQYQTLSEATDDIFSLADYLKNQSIYVNGESSFAKAYFKPGHIVYSVLGINGWRVSDVGLSVGGISFMLNKGTKKLNIKSSLLGRHQIGPLAFAAILGLKIGLTVAEVERGIAKTAPFEHRMQPRNLNGAWIIDDTYNGNIDGVEAGLALLKELPAKRKIYVSPGLVDQGVETAAVHNKMGDLIALAKPDKVVLMKNSVTDYIIKELKQSAYAGEIQIEANPLDFYTNIEHVVASGDLVLMQNDWTDNYA